ncbi:EscG/YscG/SsaH family type III secretion system needle protein co-chaperone [Burkholderia stabilis]|uniref:EscG/YscG/SsaH family type III secretion system needle protein co-chaperone n=1 Tax=Burkholderia stabilis TaxID=95485 RepID=A0A4Q2A7S9_9BURK|nr:EscG/YscG/SsaH family type III secretion system needle protein co-chaperone [Burkholderia stabilis]RXV65299.1 EscG/YscG/SsaH family type III secretion system needle protein co-chaperone [Burkholderia stabilis]
MSLQSADMRRLIVEAGLAAVNHGLYREAWAIHSALPTLIPDANDRRAIEVVMLIGLGRIGSAARLLEQAPAQHAKLLSPLLAPPVVTPFTHLKSHIKRNPDGS